MLNNTKIQFGKPTCEVLKRTKINRKKIGGVGIYKLEETQLTCQSITKYRIYLQPYLSKLQNLTIRYSRKLEL